MLPSYFFSALSQNTLARRLDFQPARFSGIDYLEGMLQKFRTASRIAAISDTCDQRLHRPSSTWLRRRTYTVCLLSRYRPGDMKDYERALNECRELYRQLLSRFLHDEGALQGSLLYLNLTDIRSEELGGTFLNNCTGLYFLLTADQPLDISYNPTEWQTPE